MSTPPKNTDDFARGVTKEQAEAINAMTKFPKHAPKRGVFLAIQALVNRLRTEGVSEAEIASELGTTTDTIRKWHGPRGTMGPTVEQRAWVARAAAMGLRQDEIALIMGINKTALRKLYEYELTTGTALQNLEVAETAFQMATSGTQDRMTIFWLKARAGWDDRGTQKVSVETALPVYHVSLGGKAITTNDTGHAVLDRVPVDGDVDE